MIEKLMFASYLNIHSFIIWASRAFHYSREEKKHRIIKKRLKNKLSNLRSMNFKVVGEQNEKQKTEKIIGP